MSSATWVNYGYGVCLKGLEFNSIERVEKMLSYAPNFRKTIHEWFKQCEIEHPTMEDYLDFDQDYYNGMAFLLKSVMVEAEQIPFASCDDASGATYVLFQPSYPWDMTRNQRKVTKRKIEKVIKKYLSMITDSKFAVCFEAAENCG